MFTRRSTVVLAVASACLLLLPTTLQAFDTGHHFDATWNALNPLGWSLNSIKAIQVHSFIADYKSNDFLETSERDQLRKLHFDNLVDNTLVTTYWTRFATNMRDTIQTVSSQDDPFKMLMLIGISLHALQDFYSHSNWAEMMSKSTGECISTFWSTQESTRNAMQIRTGTTAAGSPGDDYLKHGSYDCGMNKDSYVNTKWFVANQYAMYGTIEWVNQVEVWTNNATLWNIMKNWQPTATELTLLNFGLKKAELVSQWITNSILGEEDGHWKGKGSGDTTKFIAESADLITSSFYSSRFINIYLNEKAHLPLTSTLMDSGLPSNPANVTAISAQSHVLFVIRTFKVDAVTNADLSSSADMVLKNTISGNTFIESAIQNADHTEPYWLTNIFLPVSTSSIDVQMDLLEQDERAGGYVNEQIMDINPIVGKTTVSFTYHISNYSLTGEIIGRHNDTPSAVTLQGDAAPVGRVKFMAFHYVSQACPATPKFMSTPDSAFAVCSDDSASDLLVYIVIGAAGLILLILAWTCYRRQKRPKEATLPQSSSL